MDITFAAPGDPRIGEVNDTNCYNSSDLGFASLYTITTTAIGSNANNVTVSAASSLRLLGSSMWALGYLPLLVGATWLLM